MNKTMSRIAGAVHDGKHLQTALYHVCPEEGVTRVYYRGTCVAQVTGTHVTLNTGGWQTVTTKNVINAALSGAGVNAYVYQRRFEWFISMVGNDAAEFADYDFHRRTLARA